MAAFVAHFSADYEPALTKDMFLRKNASAELDEGVQAHSGNIVMGMHAAKKVEHGFIFETSGPARRATERSGTSLFYFLMTGSCNTSYIVLLVL